MSRITVNELEPEIKAEQRQVARLRSQTIKNSENPFKNDIWRSDSFHMTFDIF